MTHSYDVRFQGFHESLQAETEGGTDRGLVLTCASTLEAGLEDLLAATFAAHDVTRDLLRSPGKPLNGLANRISVSFALGLITASDRLSLEIVRDVAAEAACGGHFAIENSEHATRIRDAYGRSGGPVSTSAHREYLAHVTTTCLSGLSRAVGAVDGKQAQIRKSY